MRKIIQTITILSIMTAVAFISGCELMDGGSKKMLPFSSPQQPASSNALLKSLAIEGFTISPSFEANTTNYSIVVKKSETTAVTVDAVGPDGAAMTAAINGGTESGLTNYQAAFTLDTLLDTNTIVVKVTSQDGTATKNYTIAVSYYGTSANLTGLTVGLTSGSTGSISSDLDPVFASGTYTYTLGISYAVTSIDITATIPTGSGMTMSVGGWTAVSGVAVPITDPVLPVSGASSTITVVVLSQDKNPANTKNYTITITKGLTPSSEARLDYLQLKGYTGTWYDVDLGITSTMLESNYMYSVTDDWVLFHTQYKIILSPLDDSVDSMTVKVFHNNQDPNTSATPLYSGSCVRDGVNWSYSFAKSTFPIDIHIHILPEDQIVGHKKVYQVRIND